MTYDPAVYWLAWLDQQAPDWDSDKLAYQVEFFCLEAKEIFDPFRGTPFCRFLDTHLKIRCQTFLDYVVQPRRLLN